LDRAEILSTIDDPVREHNERNPQTEARQSTGYSFLACRNRWPVSYHY
jgi:hypothetical protein